MHRGARWAAGFASAIALFGACASPRPLDHVRESGGVRVEAETADLADAVRDAVSAVVPRLLEVEGFTLPREIRIVARQVDELWIDGRRFDDRIEIDVPRSASGLAAESSALEPAQGLRLLVAHELGHHLLDAAWRRLPAVLEEGLVEFAAQRAARDEAPTRRATLALFLAADQGQSIPLPGSDRAELDTQVSWVLGPGYRRVTARQAFELTRSEFVDLPIDARQVATAFGWRLVEGRGLPHLRRTVIQDANVPRTPEEWWSALGREAPMRAIDLGEIRELIGPAEAAALRRWRAAAARE